MECDYIKWLDVANCQLDELTLSLQTTEQELSQCKNELEILRTNHTILEKKYCKAKKYIKEFKRRFGFNSIHFTKFLMFILFCLNLMKVQ